MDGKSINRRKKKVSNNERRTSNYKINKKKILSDEHKMFNNEVKREGILNNEETNNKIVFLYIAIIVAVTFAVFSPTFNNTFTNWDDGKYVSEYPLIQPLNSHTVTEIFTSKDLGLRYWMGNYHPLTMLSLNINYTIAQKDADGNAKPFTFQLINILLHILRSNTIIFY